MDVHAPHHPIGGWKDFFIHLVTITVGLLIAVGIEGLVERHREHVLVREALATLHEEITHNNGVMRGVVTSVAGQRAIMQKNMDLLRKVQENAKAQPGPGDGLNASFQNVSLDTTAWRTAQATGALSYMPYAEAGKYSDLYLAQQMYLDQQDKIQADEADVLGSLAETDFGHGDITREQASLLLRSFGRWQAHLIVLDIYAKLSSQSDQAFLDGKEAPKSIHEDLGGGK